MAIDLYMELVAMSIAMVCRAMACINQGTTKQISNAIAGYSAYASAAKFAGRSRRYDKPGVEAPRAL